MERSVHLTPMDTLLISLLCFGVLLFAYHTYGKWLGQKVFGLQKSADVPSKQLQDGKDFVPTKTEVVFGHHFTSIAGTGPIVGPAIAVFWGWLPALLWVVFGSIFIGAVHDFSALVLSLRSRGQTIGEIAGRMINKRAKILFLLILFFALSIVLGIFGLVIAIIFASYPETVLTVWMEIPMAILIGYLVYKKGVGLLWPSILALLMMYVLIGVGAYWLPIDLAAILNVPLVGDTYMNAVVIWTVILLVYCFVASVLPVWTLLQPRDYINSHELIVALVLIVAGLLVAGFSGDAQLIGTAPVIAQDVPPDAPPIFPFLFITIACGAISGFHCLVSSGTSSKQLEREDHARAVGYGAMLLEGALAVIVIMACVAGVGMGTFTRQAEGTTYAYVPTINETTGQQLAGSDAWHARYALTRVKKDAEGNEKVVGGWGAYSLKDKVSAFIEGGANFLGALGIPIKFAIGMIAVLVASFAATTLDTATRLQRYVIQELSSTARIPFFTNKYAATLLAIILGGMIAMVPGALGPGSGGLILWPLFGAINQLLAGLAFLVIVFYLRRKNMTMWFALIPGVLMLILPAIAMFDQMFDPVTGWFFTGKKLLLTIGFIIQALQIWIIIEGVLMWKRVKGVEPEALPPLPRQTSLEGVPDSCGC